MKRKTQVAALTVALFAAFGALPAQADSSYPADAEASYSLPASDTYADQQARIGDGPDSQQWGVGKRQPPTPHNPFPFGGGYHDD
jgi:hypothetical protein